MTLPEGWTDDMSVRIAAGKTEEDLTLRIMSALRDRASTSDMMNICMEDFGLTEDDADLAIDRVHGGIVRAITCNPKNKPDKEKDPLAWHSFVKVWQTLPKLHWWSSKRDNKGEWLDWHNERSERSQE